MKCSSILIVVLLGSLTAVGQTKGVDGNDLLPMCKVEVAFLNNPTDLTRDSSGDFSMGYCLGLVTGVADSTRLCSTDGSDAEYGQSVRIVVKFLEDHPEKLGLKNTVLIRQALVQAFPCRKK